MRKLVRIIPSRERSRFEMSKEEYLEFIRQQPYDAMGDFGFLLRHETEKSESPTAEGQI